MKKNLYTLSIISALVIGAYLLTPSSKLFQVMRNLERSLAKLELKTVQIPEGEISYLESKNKKLPTLLLLHGFGANKDSWSRMSKHLSEKFHIIALDLPAFGNSFKDMDKEYGVHTQVKRLDEFISSLNISKFHIAGNSMGGLIAGNYAAKFEGKITSLWLLNPLGVVAAPKSEMAIMIEKNIRPKILAKTPKDFKELLDFVFFKKPYIPSFLEENLAKEATSNYLINAKVIKQIHRVYQVSTSSSLALDVILKGFNKPTLITWGDKDRVLHFKGAEVLAKNLSSVTLNIQKDIGHLPMLEAPKETAQAFLNFEKNI